MDWYPLWNSLRIALISCAAVFFLGIFAAYYIARLPRVVKGVLDVLLTLPMVLRRLPVFFRLTADVAAIGIYIWLISIDLSGSRWFRGLALPMIGWAGVLVFLLSFLLRGGRRSTLSAIALVIGAAGLLAMGIEFCIDRYFRGVWQPGWSLIVLAVCVGLIIPLLFTARSRDSRTPIFRFACVFSNAGYMGLPLISALFGSEGLLYASAFFTMFNLLLWTLGYSMVSGSSDPQKVAQSLLHCPAIYAIVVGLAIYLLQIPLPDLIVQPMELLGDMNTPLSMLITGMLIASGDLHRTLTDQHIWKLTVVRMLFIPVLTIAAFAALGLFRYGMVTQVIVLLECCPAASITSVFAVQFHHDEQFAAGSVVLTTLLSIVFLPLCALIITMF